MFICKYFPEKKLILTVLYNHVYPGELYEIIEKLRKINLQENNLKGITVLCENVKAKNINVSDIVDMGSKMQKICYKQNFKNAFVTKTLLSFALVRTYKMVLDLVTTDEINIFKKNELPQAITWLAATELEKEISAIIKNCEKEIAAPLTDRNA